MMLRAFDDPDVTHVEGDVDENPEYSTAAYYLEPFGGDGFGYDQRGGKGLGGGDAAVAGSAGDSGHLRLVKTG